MNRERLQGVKDHLLAHPEEYAFDVFASVDVDAGLPERGCIAYHACKLYGDLEDAKMTSNGAEVLSTHLIVCQAQRVLELTNEQVETLVYARKPYGVGHPRQLTVEAAIEQIDEVLEEAPCPSLT